MRRQAPEPEPQTTVTRGTFANYLAASFTNGTSFIDKPQSVPPPVGLGQQVRLKVGEANFKPLTDEQKARGEEATPCKANTKDPVSMYKRTGRGKAVMHPNQALPTLEGLVARGFSNSIVANGGDPGNVRFATMAQANGANRAHTQRGRGVNILKRDAVGVGVEMALPSTETRNLGRQNAVDPDTGKVKRDANNQPIEETIEQADPAAKGGRAAKSNKKVLYNTDDFAFDKEPEHIFRLDPDDRAKGFDKEGKPLDMSTGAKGKILYNEKGQPAFKNFDDQGHSIPPRVGDVRRNEDGSPVMRSVVRTARSAHEKTDLDTAVTHVKQALEDQSGRRVENTRTDVTIVRSDKAKDLDLKMKLADPADPETRNQVTLTVPAAFPNKKAELSTLSRASAHLEQVIDTANPNYTNATRAAAMTPAKRVGSQEFASAELVAQHAAMNNVTRAGETYEPMPKAHNDKLRGHWAKQVEDPDGRGLQTFADATDRCTRVVGGKQPTVDLDKIRLRENQQLGRAVKRAERAEQAQEQAQQRPGARPVPDISDMAAAAPDRGAGAGPGGVDADAAASAGKKRGKKAGAPGDADPTGSGKR
jgi:hypothetical protein